MADKPEDDTIPPPLCVFCNAPWTDEMLKVSAQAELDWGYYGDASVDYIDANIDVVCSSCGQLVYRKEVRRISNGI